jgi:hypothetical protein
VVELTDSQKVLINEALDALARKVAGQMDDKASAAGKWNDALEEQYLRLCEKRDEISKLRMLFS